MRRKFKALAAILISWEKMTAGGEERYLLTADVSIFLILRKAVFGGRAAVSGEADTEISINAWSDVPIGGRVLASDLVLVKKKSSLELVLFVTLVLSVLMGLRPKPLAKLIKSSQWCLSSVSKLMLKSPKRRMRFLDFERWVRITFPRSSRKPARAVLGGL